MNRAACGPSPESENQGTGERRNWRTAVTEKRGAGVAEVPVGDADGTDDHGEDLA